MKVLFICLGNICRSPAAEGVFRFIVEREGLEESFEIDSAGTYGGHAGNLPDARMRAAALKRGYVLDSRSRKLTSDDFYSFDMLIVMDDANYERVSRLAPDMPSLQKLYRMRDYLTRYSIDHIPDPYYEGVEGFEYVLDLLEDACANLLSKLR